MSYFHDAVFGDIKSMAVEFTNKNYGYCYLKAMHEKIEEEGTEVLIVGCSHSMNGVIESEMKRKTINLSVSSQDLYYCSKQIDRVIEKCKPRYCFINMGYWGLYQNLAKQENEGILVDVLFNQLFHDSHGKEVVDVEAWKHDSESFHRLEAYFDKETLKNMSYEWGKNCLKSEGSFYNTLLKREDNSELYSQGIVWDEISDEQRIEKAIERATDHNHFRKYEETKNENIKILSQIIKNLANNNIIPIVVIFPQTKEYARHIDEKYKEEIIDVLNRLEEEVFFWDMNEETGFDKNDFIDSDHLNLKGAKKATAMINDYLDLIEL